MAFTRKNRKTLRPKSQLTDLQIPNHFRCPISLDLMKDPVIVSTGITYDRPSIETWLDTGNRTCPVSNQPLPTQDLIPNHSLRRMIQDWCVSNKLHGIERIPTPKTPITVDRAFEILLEVTSYKNHGSVVKIQSLAKESERNKRCFAAAGVTRVLAKLYSEASCMDYVDMGLLDEILCTLVYFLPFEFDEDYGYFRSPNSLLTLSSTLRFGDLSSRLNAIEILKEAISSNREVGKVAVDTNGLMEGVVELIKTPISSKAMKTSLLTSYYLMSMDEKATRKFVELGIVRLVLELLVDLEKSVCEKALLVFDAVCSSERGREEACENALCVPVLVKKMFRVSDRATEFVVSSMWKLCKSDGGGGVLSEAMQVGAFQKVLLLLQIGCGLGTKEKATDLLKLMNGCGAKFDCVDVLDFKGLKRSM